MSFWASYYAGTSGYSPADMMQRDNDWVSPGVLSTSDLVATQTGTPSMAVAVTGAAQGSVGGNVWLPGGYRVYNDSNATIAVAAANPTYPRIDLLIACVDTTTSPYTPSLKVVTGTPASSPAVPAVPVGLVALALYQIAVAANATSIVNANLTDIRVVASLNLNASNILTLLKMVDGTGSGLDADLLDGQQGSYYATAAGLTATNTNATTHLANTAPHGATATPTAGHLPLYDTNGNLASNYPVSGQNPNLLFNPSFNLGAAGWTLSNAGTSSWGVVDDYGGAGMYLNCGGVTNAVPIATSSFIIMGSGITFTVSGRMYAGGNTAGQQNIDVQYLNSSKVVIGPGNRVSAVNGSSWNMYTVTNTTPANTAYIQIRCFGDNGFTTTNAAWQKIKVEQGSIATTYSDDSTLNLVQYANVLPLAQKCASVSDMLIPIITGTTVALFTPTYQGNFDAKVYLRVLSACNVVVGMNWTDATGTQNVILCNQALGVGTHSLPSYFLNCTASNFIQIYVTPTVPNAVYVSASIVGV